MIPRRRSIASQSAQFFEGMISASWPGARWMGQAELQRRPTQRSQYTPMRLSMTR